MMSAKTDVIIASVKKYILMASVKVLSITSTSLENRFVIRPNGVVSKKDIGALRARDIARLSMLLLADVPITVRETEKANSRKTWLAPNAP